MHEVPPARPVSAPHPTGWHAVVEGLLGAGFDTVFGLPSDDLGLLRAAEDSALKVVLCRDQRNAVLMAAGHALATGRPGVCVVGKGPALANAVAGLVEAETSRLPVLLLATGTASGALGTGAFQELDQVALVRPVTKLARRVEAAERLPDALEHALGVAAQGRPGPVYLELPDQLAAAPVPASPPLESGAVLAQRPVPDPELLARTAAEVSAARRPLVLAGGGLRHRAAERAAERLAEALGAGLFTTASGRGSVDERHPAFCGLAGLYATGPAEALWRDADLVIALGSRLEETALYGWGDQPGPPRVLQVNLAAEDFQVRLPGPRLLGDAAAAALALAAAPDAGRGTEPEWIDRVGEVRAELHQLAAGRIAAAEQATGAGTTEGGRVPVVSLLAALAEVTDEDTVLVQENGLQDMWSYHYPHWVCRSAGANAVPGEQTSLGFAGPAALGIAAALPHQPVVAFMGDGAYQLFRSDLRTGPEHGVPVLNIVLDNGGYGWLEHQLKDGTAASPSRFRFAAPDGPSAEPAGTDDGSVLVTRVEDPAKLSVVLRAAWEAYRGGRTVVVVVPVALTDTAPGTEIPGGDFPGAPGDQP